MKRKIGCNYGHVMKNWSCVFCGMIDEDTGFRDGCKKVCQHHDCKFLVHNDMCETCRKIHDIECNVLCDCMANQSMSGDI